MFSIGLMSGTSMDGIDCALIETDGTPNFLTPLVHTSIIYDPQFHLLLKASEYVLRKHAGSLVLAEQHFTDGVHEFLQAINLTGTQGYNRFNQLCQYLLAQGLELSFQSVVAHSTQLHAQIVQELLRKANLTPNDIDVVGYHGQTLYHRPHEGISIVIGDGQLLAEQLSIPVVNDFRSNDIKHGGQGAPLAPIYHQALAIQHHLLPLCVVNCGGIANITVIPDASPDSLLAFDTGPGNGLLDRFVRNRTKGQDHMDKDGHWGLKGLLNQYTFDALYQRGVHVQNQNYLELKPPKSLDIGDLFLVPELEKLSLEDGCRTLAAFTADTIVRSLKYLDNVPSFWVLAGGGWHNPVIKEELKTRLHQTYNQHFTIKTADEINWQNQALEAQIFAYLAVRHLKNLPFSYPGTTRVKMPLSGGVLYT